MYHGEGFHRIEPADGSSFGRVTSIVPTPADGVWLAAMPETMHIAADEVATAVEQPDYRVRCDFMDSITVRRDLPQGGSAPDEQLKKNGGY